MNNNTIPVLPETFWKLFNNELRNNFLNNNKVISIYQDDKKWTKYITSFLKTMGEKSFSLYVDQEYWPRVDVGFFDKISDNWGNWSYEVAIEIENNIQKCHEEICKLLLLKVGLKVLITYYKNENIVNQIITKFIDVYKSRKYYQIEENWLFIFMPCAYENWEIDNIIAYKFNGEKIIKLENGFNILKP